MTTLIRRCFVAAALILAKMLGAAAPALAGANPPTHGGNGGGQGGQCTGNPNDRPASCGPDQVEPTGGESNQALDHRSLCIG